MRCSLLPPLSRAAVPHSAFNASIQRQTLHLAKAANSRKHRRRLLHHVVGAAQGSEGSADAATPASVDASASRFSDAAGAASTSQLPPDDGRPLRDEVSDPAQPLPYASEATESTATRVDLSSNSSNGGGTDSDSREDGALEPTASRVEVSSISRDGAGMESSSSAGGNTKIDGAEDRGNGAEEKQALGARLWAEAQQGQQARVDFEQKPKLPTRRKKKRKSSGFLDTMADVEASQNAFLSRTEDDGDSPLASVEQTGSYDDPATWSSVDWDEFAAQVAPTASAEQMREFRSSTRSFAQLGQSAPVQWVNDTWGRIRYNYFNWRKNSVSDLLLIIAINFGILLLGGLLKMVLVDPLEDTPEGFWANIYDIMIIVFGQQLPDADAGLAAQLFGVAAASTGLASFALVLALVEQIVLQVIESNVKRGSSVYEQDHILVLAWADNRKDLEVVWKVLSQVCLAYRCDGGRVVVVLSSRDKLEMEDLFRRTIPEDARYGTQFVFRQGNPLVPDDLRSVAASSAAAICVVSDTSRYPSEADAQAVRVAVLLDELDFPGLGQPDPRVGHIVVELKTANAVPLLRYSCSPRIIGLPTAQLNARRMARIIKSPVVGMVSSFMWSFNSQSQVYLERFPQFVGRTFGSITFQLPDGIPFGIVNHFSGQCHINPLVGTFINEGDEIVMLRPTSFKPGDYQPAEQPVDMPHCEWTESDYVCTEWDLSSEDIVTMSMDGMESPARAMFEASDGEHPASPQYLLPMEYTHSDGAAEKILICGWGEPTFMSNLLRELDHGPAALPKNSEVVMFNRLETEQQQAMLSDFGKLRNVRLLHLKGNPLNRKELAEKIDIQSYKSAVVLCDMEWVDPDLRVANGIAISDQGDMLRLDAMLMTVQLNLRKMLEEANMNSTIVVAEKCAFEGTTRFEDGLRLPLGISVNFPSFAAGILTEVAYNPKVLLPFSHMGETDEMRVQDSSCLSARNERISFWELQRRAQCVGQVLLGYLEVPQTMDQQLHFVVNPVGADMRAEERVWNSGDQRTKLITISPKEEEASGGRLRSRMAQSAIRETLGSSGGPQRKSVVMDAPLKATSTLTDELLEAAVLNASATAAGGAAPASKQKFSSV